MINRLSLAFIIFISCAVHAQTTQIPWSTQYHLGTRALYIESATQQVRSFGISPAIAFSSTLFSDLNFKARASALLETGSHKGTLLDEFKPDQQVLLDYAFFDYQLWSQFNLHAGAIPMRERAPNLLIDSSRFLGVAAEQSLSLWSDVTFKLHALSAIPSNQELTNRLGGVSEGTPNYWQAGFDFSIPGDLLAFDLDAFAWGYSDVAGEVAFQSGFMGNQTNGIGRSNTRLSYAYRGTAARVDLTGHINFWRWGLGADYVFNDGAPDGRNEAKRARLLVGYNTHEFKIAWFEIEADAAISYYNSSLLGHTNRKGFSLDYSYTYNAKGQVGASLVQAQTLRSTLLQSDQDGISLWWKITL